MLPDPLHPAVVHLPIAIAALAPFAALLAVLAIRAGWVPARTWLAVVLLQALLAGSAWLAIETGEDQEEKVEDVVGERHIHDHEEAAERFLYLAIAAGLVSATGLVAGRRGGIGRVATVAAAAVVLAAGLQVGHSGGELVYRHGAASVYVDQGKADRPVSAEHRRDDDD
jgi:hypothetical protein